MQAPPNATVAAHVLDVELTELIVVLEDVEPTAVVLVEDELFSEGVDDDVLGVDAWVELVTVVDSVATDRDEDGLADAFEPGSLAVVASFVGDDVVVSAPDVPTGDRDSETGPLPVAPVAWEVAAFAASMPASKSETMPVSVAEQPTTIAPTTRADAPREKLLGGRRVVLMQAPSWKRKRSARPETPLRYPSHAVRPDARGEAHASETRRTAPHSVSGCRRHLLGTRARRLTAGLEEKRVETMGLTVGRRRVSMVGALLVSAALCSRPTRAHADAPAAALLRAFAPTGAPERPAPPRVEPFGAAPAPRVALFPVLQVTRPLDIPPPKPTKGLALVFDW